MSLARRSAVHSHEIAAATARPSLLVAAPDARPGANPVLDQHLRLASAFAADPHQEHYPAAVKLAIFVGAPTALWSGIIVAGAFILHRFG